MTVINTNTASLVAGDAIQRNDRAMAQSMEWLSTGSRINSPRMTRQASQFQRGCQPR